MALVCRRWLRGLGREGAGSRVGPEPSGVGERLPHGPQHRGQRRLRRGGVGARTRHRAQQVWLPQLHTRLHQLVQCAPNAITLCSLSHRLGASRTFDVAASKVSGDAP
eukprot:7756210-Pyramimonas_sp.AAC.1